LRERANRHGIPFAHARICQITQHRLGYPQQKARWGSTGPAVVAHRPWLSTTSGAPSAAAKVMRGKADAEIGARNGTPSARRTGGGEQRIRTADAARP
jgi:hypothetical protein